MSLQTAEAKTEKEAAVRAGFISVEWGKVLVARNRIQVRPFIMFSTLI